MLSSSPTPLYRLFPAVRRSKNAPGNDESDEGRTADSLMSEAVPSGLDPLAFAPTAVRALVVVPVELGATTLTEVRVRFFVVG